MFKIHRDHRSASLQRRFVHNALDEPLVWLEGTGTSNRKWHLADERGSVIAYANATAGVTDINKYDPFGVPDAANTGRFRYAGAPWIASASLTHMRARNYSAATGRFMQPDPIGYAGGMNLYGYVGNDPVNFTDPFGLASVCIDAPGYHSCDSDSHFIFNFGGFAGGPFAGDRVNLGRGDEDDIAVPRPQLCPARMNTPPGAIPEFVNSGGTKGVASGLLGAINSASFGTYENVLLYGLEGLTGANLYPIEQNRAYETGAIVGALAGGLRATYSVGAYSLRSSGVSGQFAVSYRNFTK